jgi:hypothetical protein
MARKNIYLAMVFIMPPPPRTEDYTYDSRLEIKAYFVNK